VRERFPFPTASATESGETTQPLALLPRYPRRPLPYVDGPRTPVSKCVRGPTSGTISR
jgi:hypothetical protein